jgi:hypothetical protein
MKTITILMILAASMAGSGFKSKGIWVIDAESQLTIQGSTNVNEFSCKIDYCTGTDTLQYVQANSTRELRFTRSRMTVPVRSFDCGAKPISKDFWKTLKAETHPNLEINFVSLQNIFFKDRTNIQGVVDITLAGVTTRYTICYDVTLQRNGNVLLNGTHAVNFSDFQLKAPEKLKGLIKVKEVLHVEFNLVLKEVY